MKNLSFWFSEYCKYFTKYLIINTKPAPSHWRFSHALLHSTIGKLLPKQSLVDQSPRGNEGWENIIPSLMQSSPLAGLITIQATYEEKPFIYFNQLLTSQLKSISNCFWVSIQQIASAHFRNNMTIKYFVFIQSMHLHCFLCASHFPGRLPGRNLQTQLAWEYPARTTSPKAFLNQTKRMNEK